MVKNPIDLGAPAKRAAGLADNEVDGDEYHKVSQSAEVEGLLDYVTRVSQYYDINATPTFIVAKKWVAIQDRDFPSFSDKLLSILKNDQAPEK